jgi:hypothetical protein
LPTAAWAASDEVNTMLERSPRIGSNCWTRKNGARTLTAKSRSKSSTVVSSIVADSAVPALATRMSRPVADDGADLPGEVVRSRRRGEVGTERLGAATGVADLLDDGLRLVGAAAIVDENLGARPGEREGGGAADAARGAGDEGGLAVAVQS